MKDKMKKKKLDTVEGPENLKDNSPPVNNVRPRLDRGKARAVKPLYADPVTAKTVAFEEERDGRTFYFTATGQFVRSTKTQTK